MIKKAGEISTKIRGRLESIDEKLAAEIDHSESLSSEDLTDFRSFKIRIAEMKSDRLEAVSRLELIDRLRMQIVDYYSGQDVKVFFQDRLSAMARSEIGLGQVRETTGRDLSDFLIDLKVALKACTLRGSDLLDFVSGYMDQATVFRKEPVIDQDAPSSGAYSDNIRSEKANFISIEEAGDQTEANLEALSREGTPIGVSRVRKISPSYSEGTKSSTTP